MKRIFTFISLFTLFIMTSWAHDVEIDGIFYNITEGSNLAYVTYKGDNYDDYSNEYSGDITIPKFITYNSVDYMVICILGDAFRDCKNLTSVKIPEGVIYIEYGAFFDCTSLVSVDIPNSVTSLNVIFMNCTSLETITLPNKITSLPYYAFQGCTSLSTIVFPDSLDFISAWSFKGCSSLTTVVFPDSLRSIGAEAFSGCKKLSNITIGKNIEFIGYDAFYDTEFYNDSLNWNDGVLYLGDYLIKAKSDEINNTYTIKEGTKLIADWAFANSNNLQEIIFPESLLYIGGQSFYSCNGLTSIEIPNNVISIGQASFMNCKGINSVKLSDNLKEIGSNALGGCDKLSSIFIPSSVTNISVGAFSHNMNLSDIVVSSDNSNYISRDGVLFSKDLTTLYVYPAGKDDTSYVIPNGVEYLAESAFEMTKYLTSVELPNTITSIPNYGFRYSGISSINLPDSLTSIGYYAFEECDSLTSINIPEKVSSIGIGSFSSCNKLVEILVSNDNKNYCSQNGVLFNKDMSTLEAYPSGKLDESYSIPNTVEKVGDHIFTNNNYINTIVIPSNVKEFGNSSILHCKNLKSVISYATTVPSIDNYSFLFSGGTSNATLYVLNELYDEYLNNSIYKSKFRTIKAIKADEVVVSDKIEVEKDKNEVTIKWQVVSIADLYELLIKKGDNIFCRLFFDKNGCLISTGLTKRSANVGFQYVVKGLEATTEYSYQILALDAEGEKLESYDGTFTTNSYEEETAIIENLADANIAVSNGLITCNSDFRIFNTIGQDVTIYNGSLEYGIYIVKVGNDTVKVRVD